MKKYDLFKAASCITILCFTIAGCSSESNEYEDSALLEGGDSVIIEDEPLHISDEVAVKSDKTLYLVKDNNINSVHELTIQDNIKKRFAKQQIVNVGSSITYQNGDCMMIDVNDISDLQSNQDIVSVIKKFYNDGGAIIFVQPTKTNIENFFKAIGYSALTTQENNKIDEIVVYKYNTTDGHVDVAVFDDLCNTDDGVYTEENDGTESTEPNKESNEGNTITEYTQGLYADQVISDVKSFISAPASPSKTIQTRGDAFTDVHKFAEAYKFRFHNSYTLNSSNYYNSKIEGGTDYFFYEISVWPFKQKATGDIYVYMEYNFTLNFSKCYQPIYHHHSKGRLYKVMEWAGSKVKWSCHTPFSSTKPYYNEATTNEYVYESKHAPTTSESSKQYTSSMSIGISGDLSAGLSSSGDISGSVGGSAGVTFGTSLSETFADVTYADQSKDSGDPSYVGGEWTLADAISKYATANYGLVRVYEPALVGRTTFCPHAACLFTILHNGKNPSGGNGKNIFIFDTEITLSSYGAYSNASAGKMRKCSYSTSFSGVIDLSNVSFSDATTSSKANLK